MFLNLFGHEVALCDFLNMVLIQVSLVRFAQENTKQRNFARQLLLWHMFIITLKYISWMNQTHQRTFLL